MKPQHRYLSVTESARMHAMLGFHRILQCIAHCCRITSIAPGVGWKEVATMRMRTYERGWDQTQHAAHFESSDAGVWIGLKCSLISGTISAVYESPTLFAAASSTLSRFATLFANAVAKINLFPAGVS